MSRQHFFRRLLLHFLGASALVLGSLLIGMAGYAHLEGLAWRDAFLNAAMLLGGMGRLNRLRPLGASSSPVFTPLYAGLVFLVAVEYRLGAGRPSAAAPVPLGR